MSIASFLFLHEYYAQFRKSYSRSEKKVRSKYVTVKRTARKAKIRMSGAEAEKRNQLADSETAAERITKAIGSSRFFQRETEKSISRFKEQTDKKAVESWASRRPVR